MLTKEDIKELRNVFREEIEAEVGTMRDELTSQIILTKMELRSDFRGVENRLKNVEIKLGRLEKTVSVATVSYTHLRAHETVLDLVCRLLLEKKNKNK